MITLGREGNLARRVPPTRLEFEVKELQQFVVINMVEAE